MMLISKNRLLKNVPSVLTGVVGSPRRYIFFTMSDYPASEQIDNLEGLPLWGCPSLRDCRCFQVFHTDSCHVSLLAAVRILGCSSVSRDNHQPPRLFKSLCYRHNSPAPMRQGGSFGEKGELSELIACCVCGSGRGGLLASSQLRAFNPVTVVGWPTRIISRNYRLRELSTAA